MGSPEQIAGIQPYAELSQGATTTVYKGFQKSLDRFVLLKVLRPEFSRDQDLVKRFEEEARLAAKIEHPNVVSVYAHGREKDTAYIAAEFVDGLSVQELIRKGRVPADIAAYIVEEAAKGLKAAHDKKILHRDVKPANIMISNEGRVKVADFGMASIGTEQNGQHGKIRGTLPYLSPEQVVGEPPTETSDVFSLGATLFEMLAGEPAFQGDSSRELLDSVQNYDPMPILMDDDTLPSQLRRICQQMLKKKPAQRYRDFAVILSDLEGFRKARGPKAVATGIDMKSYLEDPEAYKKRQRDKPVTLRERSASPRASTAEGRTASAKKDRKAASEVDLKRLFTTVGLVVLVFAGLSFAGSFFFSKDGDFGATSNSAGASKPTPSVNDGSPVVAGRGKRSGGGAVQAAGSDPAAPPAPGIQVEDAPLVVVNEEDDTDDEPDASLPAHASRPASVSSDTVTIVDEPGRAAGRIMVDATPWAYVYVEGDSVGITPLPMVASPGTYALTLRNPGFPPFETMVDVIPGRETPVYVSLWTLVGTLTVDVFPYARVSIDGVYRDDTPFERPLVVTPGAHTLTLVHPSLGTFESTFEISAGEVKTLKFNLDEME